MSTSLPFDIVSASSEEAPFNACELLREAEDISALRGWRTARNCRFPQHLILRFKGDVDLTQLQLLSHECLISTRVEVHAFQLGTKHDLRRPPSFHNVRFQKLGSIKFNSNEKSKFRSKERKTVHLRATCYFLKLVFHEPHPNNLNTQGQVGVYSIAAGGTLISHVPAHRDLALPPPPLAAATNDQWPAEGSGGGGGGGGGGTGMTVLPPIRTAAPPRQPSGRGTPVRYGTNLVGSEGQESVYDYNLQSNDAPAPSLAALHRRASGPYPDGALRPQPPRQHPIAGAQLPPIGGPSGYQLQLQQQQQQQRESGHSVFQFRSHRIIQFEGFYLQKRDDLIQRKAQAVSVEDFDTAKHCKESLLLLQDMSDNVYALEAEKVRAIYEEDFQMAEKVKVEMDKLVEEAMLVDAAPQREGGGTKGPGRRRGDHDEDRASRRRRRGSGVSPSAIQARQRRNGDTNDEDDEASEWRQQQQQQQQQQQPPAHAFEEQPVVSRYAQMMAAQQRNADEVVAGSSTEHSPVAGERGHRRRSGAESSREGDQSDEGSGSGEDDDHSAGSEGSRADGAPSEHEEDSGSDASEGSSSRDRDDEADAEESSAVQRRSEKGKYQLRPRRSSAKSRSSGKARSSAAEAGGGDVGAAAANDSELATAGVDAAGNPVGSFKLENFADWERDVFFAIHDEVGVDSSEPPADPVDTAERTEVPEFNAVLGHYATACLFSKRWKLRDAAVRVITKFLGLHFRHVSGPQALALMLRYADLKGFGLLDSIHQVFVSVTELLVKIIEDGFEDCPLASVHNQVANLLPRMILRAGDPNLKIRDDATALVLLVAGSSIGPDRVAAAIVTDPVDHDKRRMSSLNHRITISRLVVLRQLMAQHKLAFRGSTSIDVVMNRLLLPGLNHSNNEVREHALDIIGILDVAHGQDVFRFVTQISNPTVRAAVEEKLAVPPPGATTDDHPDEGQSQVRDRKGRKRGDSKTRK